MLKRTIHVFILVLCLLSLANCRRGGGMMGGGGPMEGGGPCGRCNQLREADNDLRRERLEQFDQNAPFPGENNNINQGIDGNLVGIGNNLVQDENILGGTQAPGPQPLQGLPGLSGPIQPEQAIDPSIPGGIAGQAVEAPGFEEGETSPETEPHRSPASDGAQKPPAHH